MKYEFISVEKLVFRLFYVSIYIVPHLKYLCTSTFLEWYPNFNIVPLFVVLRLNEFSAKLGEMSIFRFSL